MILHAVLMPVLAEAPERTSKRVTMQREASREALRECARRSGVPIDGWVKGPDNVPRAQGIHHWSVTHKRLWSAAVIADRPVGIDIEHVLPRRNESVFDAVASAAEWSIVGERSWPAFFRLWTAKEATLKANGQGIGQLSECRLASIPDAMHMTLLYRNEEWLIEHFHHADHVAAVTCVGDGVSWAAVDNAG